jgi:hypothetical protein
MNKVFRYVIVLSLALFYDVGAWAKGQVVIRQTGQGEVSYSFKESYYELTTVPASGFYVTVDNIKVYKTVEGGSAQSPRRTPNLAEPIAVTAYNPDANPTGRTQYRFSPEGDFDYEVFVDFQSSQANNLFLVNGRMVTEQNRGDILNDGGTMKFNAANNRLVFTNLSTQDVNIESWMDNMVVYLKEANNMTASDGFLFKGHGGNLTFTTDGNDAGTLGLRIEAQLPVITGFNLIIFEQNLTLLSGSYDGQEAGIGTPVKPIADEEEPENTVDLGETGEVEDLSNTIINDVLYTLDAGNDDGIDVEEKSVVLGSTMAEDDINEIVDTYTPGTDEFAEHFAGVTFMIPAGTGKVLVTAKTGEDGIIHVKIGSQAPFVISGVLEYTDFEIPYACTQATYVYVYNASPAVEAARAIDHRAGKKTTVTVGLSSIGVNVADVQSSNDEGNVDAETVVLTAEDIICDLESASLVINNNEVTTIADDAFAGFPFLKYIDLRNTQITGVNVNRLAGPFMGVSKNTFIYLPTGNTTDEPNVVIGNICDNVLLDANMKKGESFGLSGKFIASAVNFNRTFKQDEMTTIYLPFPISAADKNTFGTFYTVEKIVNGKVIVKEVEGNIQAHKPYLFKAVADDTRLYNLSVIEMSMPEQSAGARRAENSSELVGCYNFLSGVGQTQAFVFSPNADLEKISFERIHADEVVKPFQAYLLSDAEGDTLGVTDKEETTGIKTVDNSQQLNANSQYYDLQGRRIANGQKPTAKGIYIVNGQKTVIR